MGNNQNDKLDSLRKHACAIYRDYFCCKNENFIEEKKWYTIFYIFAQTLIVGTR